MHAAFGSSGESPRPPRTQHWPRTHLRERNKPALCHDAFHPADPRMRLANTVRHENFQMSERTTTSHAEPIDSPKPHLRNGLLRNPCDRSDHVCLHRLHLHHCALNRGQPHQAFRRPNVIKSGFLHRTSIFIHHPARKSLRGVIGIRPESGSFAHLRAA